MGSVGPVHEVLLVLLGSAWVRRRGFRGGASFSASAVARYAMSRDAAFDDRFASRWSGMTWSFVKWRRSTPSSSDSTGFLELAIREAKVFRELGRVVAAESFSNKARCRRCRCLELITEIEVL